MTYEFNKYAKANNLDMELFLNLYTSKNSSLLVNNYGTSLEYLMNKGLTDYDLYFYDIMYTKRYSSYLEDLRDWLPEDHLELYSSGVASQFCKNGDKWVGLVSKNFFFFFFFFFFWIIIRINFL